MQRVRVFLAHRGGGGESTCQPIVRQFHTQLQRRDQAFCRSPAYNSSHNICRSRRDVPDHLSVLLSSTQHPFRSHLHPETSCPTNPTNVTNRRRSNLKQKSDPKSSILFCDLSQNLHHFSTSTPTLHNRAPHSFPTPPHPSSSPLHLIPLLHPPPHPKTTPLLPPHPPQHPRTPNPRTQTHHKR